MTCLLERFANSDLTGNRTDLPIYNHGGSSRSHHDFFFYQGVYGILNV